MKRVLFLWLLAIFFLFSREMGVVVQKKKEWESATFYEGVNGSEKKSCKDFYLRILNRFDVFVNLTKRKVKTKPREIWISDEFNHVSRALRLRNREVTHTRKRTRDFRNIFCRFSHLWLFFLPQLRHNSVLFGSTQIFQTVLVAFLTYLSGFSCFYIISIFSFEPSEAIDEKKNFLASPLWTFQFSR